MKEDIERYLEQGADLRLEMMDRTDKIDEAAQMLIDCFDRQCKVMLCGNGGSAADSQHIAAEFVNKFYMDREGLPAIALTTDTSIITSASNDYGYPRVFEKQVEALGDTGDVLIGISTSGNSENVVRALKKAREMGIKTIGLTGKGGGKMKEVVDLLIDVPSDDTPSIQEIHITVGHIICLLVEREIFG